MMKHPLNLRDTDLLFERIRRNPKQNVARNILILLLIFIAYFLVAALTEGMFTMLFFPPHVDVQLQEGGVSADVQMTPDDVRNALYMTLVSIAMTFLFCLCIEKRGVRTMGLTKRRAVPDYLIGVLLGLGLMAATVMIAWGLGGVTCQGTAPSIPVQSMLLFTVGWMIQGFSEELTFRGYLMMSGGTHHAPLTGVCISSLLFAAAHLGNDGISVFACVNLTLFGLLAALLFLRTDSIWCVAALHSFWNMAQGNVFGLKVSGLDIGVTFFRFDMVPDKDWINGGGFGLEGGIATTIVMTLGIIVIFLMPQRQPDQLPPPLPPVQPQIPQMPFPMPLYPQQMQQFPQQPGYPQAPMQQYPQQPGYPQYPQQPGYPQAPAQYPQYPQQGQQPAPYQQPPIPPQQPPAQ